MVGRAAAAGLSQGTPPRKTLLEPLGPSTFLYTMVQVHFLYWIILATRSQAPSTALTSCALSLSRQGDVSRALPCVTLGACLTTSLYPSFQTRGPYSSPKAVLRQVPLSGPWKQRPSSLCLPRQKEDGSWYRVPGAARQWLFQLPEQEERGFWFQPRPSPSVTALGKSLTPNLLLVRRHLTGSPMKGPHVEAG